VRQRKMKKEIPKELIRIVNKPLIKYAVEEVIAASIDTQTKNFSGIDSLYKVHDAPKNDIDTTTMAFLKFSDFIGMACF